MCIDVECEIMVDSIMKTHIAIFPSPGMGHLIPLTELAHRLLHHHPHFFITFIISTTTGSPVKPQNDILNTMPENVTSIFLPPVDVTDVPYESRISLTIIRSLPALRETFVKFTRDPTRTRPSALIVDVFGPPAFEIAREFDIPPYLFSTLSAMSIVSIFHAPLLDKMFSCEYRELLEPIRLPGCVPFPGSDIPEPLHDKKNDAYKNMVEISKMFSLAKGILVNSFFELEPSPFKAMEEGEWCKPDIYSVGPLIRRGSDNPIIDPFECLKWLDKHPVGSVLLLSFGSGGTLSQKQLDELAFGLEESGQNFLWVVKSPDEKSNASYFDAQSRDNPFEFLPNRFVDRVKDRGLIVSSWAPQAQILSHRSTGGFVTHCGWNSILESVVNGVPMIAWPLYAEQKMNAVFLSDGLGVSCRVKVDENGVVGRGEINKCVKSLMEGEDGRKMRLKMNKLKDLAAMAVSQDGSSTRSLSHVIQRWTN